MGEKATHNYPKSPSCSRDHSDGVTAKTVTSTPTSVRRRSSHLKDTLVDDIRNSKTKKNEDSNGLVEQDEEKGGARNDNKLKIRHQQPYENLLQEEIDIRLQVESMPGAQGHGGLCNVVGSTIVNMISAFLIFAVYLISLESLLSIGLSIGLTICK
jgi:hypothetical protein